MSEPSEAPLVAVECLRICHFPRGFTGFANGLDEGDVVTVEFAGEKYRVRVVAACVVPSCVTPYIRMEIA